MEKISTVIDWTFRILLGGFFCIAGVLKGLDPAAFQQEILAYQIVGYPVSFFAAYFLPYFEIVVGLGLGIGWNRRLVLGMISGLLVIFLAALTWTWYRGIDINCGCLGKIDFIEGQPAAIVRDLLLLVMAIFLFLKETARSVER